MTHGEMVIIAADNYAEALAAYVSVAADVGSRRKSLADTCKAEFEAYQKVEDTKQALLELAGKL